MKEHKRIMKGKNNDIEQNEACISEEQKMKGIFGAYKQLNQLEDQHRFHYGGFQFFQHTLHKA